MTFPLFPEDGHRRYYKGKASAPFIPSFQGAYKKGDWTVPVASLLAVEEERLLSMTVWECSIQW